MRKENEKKKKNKEKQAKTKEIKKKRKRNRNRRMEMEGTRRDDAVLWGKKNFVIVNRIMRSKRNFLQ